MAMYLKYGALTLTTGNYRLLREIDFGEGTRRFCDLPSAVDGLAAGQRSRDGGIVEQPIHLRVYGGITNWNLIVAELEKETNTLEVYAPGGTAALIFQTFRSQVPHVAWSPDDETLLRTDIDFTVRRQPWGALAAAETLRSYAELYVPAAVSLAAQTGSRATPLVTRIERYSGETAVLDGLWVARGPSSSWTGWKQEAESLTWAGGASANAADASACGGNRRTVTAVVGSPATTTVADQAFPAGVYRVLVRAKSTGGTGGVKHEFMNAYLPVTSATWLLHDLGDVALPAHLGRGSGSSTLGFSCYQGSAALYVDYIALLPTEGLTYVARSGLSALDKVYLDCPSAYVNDLIDYLRVTGCGPNANGGQLILVPEVPAATGAQFRTNTGITAYPRYYFGK